MDQLIRKFLQEHVLFREYANPDFISSLASSMKPRMFVDGAYIIRKGEIGRAMFFNLKGNVEVISDDGETVINVMQEGSFFGEIGVLYSVSRTVSCRSNGKSIILTLTKEALDAALAPYPQIAKSIALIAEQRYSSHMKKKESAVNEEFGEELNLCITHNELQNVSIFKDADGEFLHQLTLSLKPVKFYQNQAIVRKGDLAKAMYFVVKGTAHVVDEFGTNIYANFGPGSFFGEVGLFKAENKRTATVKCASESAICFTCEKSDLDSLLVKFPAVKGKIEEEMQRRLEYIQYRETTKLNADIELATEIETIREKLKMVPIFRDAKLSFLHDIACKMHVKRETPGQLIVREGDVSDSMYFIIDGTVEVVSSDGTQIFAEMSKDSFFGEVSLFYNINRTASVRAKTETTLIVLGKSDLDSTLLSYPDLKESIQIVASENYRSHCARKQSASLAKGISEAMTSIEATTDYLKQV